MAAFNIPSPGVWPFFKRPPRKITTPFIPRLSGGGIILFAGNCRAAANFQQQLSM